MKTNAHQILAFAHVIRDGSFSAAARRIGVTQSALSQHIGKLETQMGARLITRSSSGLELTRAGQEIFALAQQFDLLASEIDACVLGYSALETGHLSIIANAPQPALGAIARYGQAFPNVEISFTLYDWTRTMAMLSDHSVDIAFITAPRRVSNCHFKKLCDTSYVLYAPRGHPLAQRDMVSLQDLRRETLILPEQGSLTRKVMSETMTRHNVEPMRRLNTTTFPVMKEAILQNIGVGVFLADAADPDHQLVQRPIRELDARFEVHAAVPKNKSGLRLVRSFWEALDPAP